MSDGDEIHAAHLEIEQQRIAEMEHVVEILRKWDGAVGDIRAAIEWENYQSAIDHIITLQGEISEVIALSEADIEAVKGDDNDGTD